MIAADVLDNRPSVTGDRAEPDAARQVVAIILVRRGRLGLLRRSARVGHDAGAWHCVTGFLDAGIRPSRQARVELFEETGLGPADIRSLSPGPVLDLPDRRGGRPWSVHTFLAGCRRRRLTLNWENDAYRWARPVDLTRLDGQVPWLIDVVRAFPANVYATVR